MCVDGRSRREQAGIAVAPVWNLEPGAAVAEVRRCEATVIAVVQRSARRGERGSTRSGEAPSQSRAVAGVAGRLPPVVSVEAKPVGRGGAFVIAPDAEAGGTERRPGGLGVSLTAGNALHNRVVSRSAGDPERGKRSERKRDQRDEAKRQAPKPPSVCDRPHRLLLVIHGPKFSRLPPELLPPPPLELELPTGAAKSRLPEVDPEELLLDPPP